VCFQTTEKKMDLTNNWDYFSFALFKIFRKKNGNMCIETCFIIRTSFVQMNLFYLFLFSKWMPLGAFAIELNVESSMGKKSIIFSQLRKSLWTCFHQKIDYIKFEESIHLQFYRMNLNKFYFFNTFQVDY